MKKLFTLIAIVLMATVNSFAYITVSGNITTNQTWTTGNTYYVSSSIYVDTGVILTIEEDVIVKFSTSSRLLVKGTLDVNGIAGGSVFFTSKNDNLIGEVISGSTGNPQDDDWGRVEIEDGNASATISYATFRYGGDYDVGNKNQGVLMFKDALPSSIEYIFIQDGYYYGLYVENTPITVDNFDISNHNHGIYLEGGDTDDFTNIWLDIDYQRMITFKNTKINDITAWDITADEDQYIEIYDGIEDQSEFNNDDNLVYILRNEVWAHDLDIEEGVIVKADTSSALIVTDGDLDVNGSMDFPVIFTSIFDDEFGGDSNGDAAATSPDKGNWKGIIVDGNSNPLTAKGTIDWCWVYYGGQQYNGLGANISFIDTRYSNFLNSRSENSNSFGIINVGQSTTVRSSAIMNNDTVGIGNYTGSSPDYGTLTTSGNNVFRNHQVFHIWNTNANDVNSYGNDWGTNDSATISARVGNSFSSGDVLFDPWFEKEDLHWQSFDKTTIENETLYGPLSLPAEETPEGTIILYKTSEGRYGKMKIIDREASSIDLWWETYNADGTTYSAGTNLHIYYSGDASFCDLDRGIRGTYLNTQSEAEFYLHNNGDLVMTGGIAEFAISYSYCSYITHNGGTTVSETWGEGTHYITGNFTIYGGDTLFIEPGAVVKFAPTGRLTGNGVIQAIGAQYDSIYFTSANDDIHGCIIDGSNTNPQAGDWGAAYFNGNSGEANGKFRFCKFSYGGNSSGGIVTFNYGAIGNMDQCTFEHSAVSGLYSYQSDIHVDSCTFQNNTNHGIQYQYYSLVDVNNSNFWNNGQYPVYVSSGELIGPNRNNNSAGNLLEGIVIASVSGDVTLSNSWSSHGGIPYIILNDLSIYSSTRIFNINSGTLVKMNSGVKIFTRGTINATAAYITSIKDDSKGGDSNNDGNATSPAPGDWENIEFQYGDAVSNIQSCEITYGGSSTAAIYFSNGAGGQVYNSKIKYSQNHGIQPSNSPVEIYYCEITDNIKSGMYVYNADSLNIHHNTISDNTEHGINVYGGESPTIDNNDIEGNGLYSIYFSGASNITRQFIGNTFAGNGTDGIGIYSLDGNKKNTFYACAGLPYYTAYPYVFLNSLHIYSSADTIQFMPGTIVKFMEGKYLQSRGAILAENTVFTSIHDDSPDYGGDTEHNGNTVTAAKGDWHYITADMGSSIMEFDNCTVNYGGSGNYAELRFESGASGYVKNSTIKNSLADGVYIQTGEVELRDNMFLFNGRYGISVYSNNDNTLIHNNEIHQSGLHGIYVSSSVSVDISDNEFINNGGYPVLFSSSVINGFYPDNNSYGNLMEGFAVQSISATQKNIFHYHSGMPYIILNDLIWYGSADTVEVQGGHFKFIEGKGLEVRGTYIQNNGIFTSINDDFYDGDTNNDGDATAGSPGDWDGIEVYYGNGQIDGGIVRFAGNADYSGIAFTQSNGFVNNIFVDSCQYDGIYVYNTNNVSIDNNTLRGNTRYGIQVNSVDTASISNNTIIGNGSHGIYNSNSAPDIDNNTFTNNAGYPVSFSTSIINKEFTGNTSSGNLMEGFYIQSLNFTEPNKLYYTPAMPYLIGNDIISYNANDTIEFENATVKFLDGKELEIRGYFEAQGSTFTSVHDDVDGDSNNDGNTTTPSPGDWDCIDTYGPSANLYFSHSKISYAGSGSNPAINVSSTGSAALTNSVIEYSGNDGLHTAGGRVDLMYDTIRNCTGEGVSLNYAPELNYFRENVFENNGSHGVQSYGGTVPYLGLNTFTGNGGYPVHVNTSRFVQYIGGNNSSGNLMEGIALQSLANDTSLLRHDENLPYLVVNDLNLYSNTKLTIQKGTVMKFFPNKYIKLNSGHVIADSVFFTSIYDDNIGGDSNNDGNATTPQAGDWYNIYNYFSSSNPSILEMNNCSVLYGGGSLAAIYLDRGIPTLTNNTIRYSATNGIDVRTNETFLNGNTITDCANYGICFNNIETASIIGNNIQNNTDGGVYVYGSSATLRGNAITNNTGYGVYIHGNSPDENFNLGNNDVNDKGENTITGNDGGNYQLYNNGAAEINAFYNDWGYNTATEIDAHIYDDNEDGNKGEVHFNPWYIYNLAVDVTAILEGPFDGTEMSTYLSGHPEPIEGFPLTQPFNTDPWNYAGTESVASIPNTDVVDWVLLELRDAADAASAGTGSIIDSKAGFLLKDGSIVETDGTSTLSFAANVSQNLFVVVHHRNHLEIMSANALSQSGGVYEYDFSTGINKAYGNSEKLVNGKAVMFGGDINADGNINNTDKAIWVNESGTTGYLKSDISFDGQIDNKDKNDTWAPNNGTDSQIPD